MMRLDIIELKYLAVTGIEVIGDAALQICSTESAAEFSQADSALSLLPPCCLFSALNTDRKARRLSISLILY